MSKKPIPTFECQLCGKTRNRQLCRTKDGRHTSYNMKQKFCSKECGWKGRAWRPISPDGYVHSSGYRKLVKRGGVQVYEHREIMSKRMGRPLRREESVHHKDGNKLNNELSNLELWSSKHLGGQRVVDKVQFAIEILTLYPEFARSAGYELHRIEHLSDPLESHSTLPQPSA